MTNMSKWIAEKLDVRVCIAGLHCVFAYNVQSLQMPTHLSVERRH